MTISMIAAVAANGVIGADGDMPWRLSTDMKRFRALTMGHPVVMGRKTFETLRKPLAGRTNIVVSRNPDYSPEGAVMAAGLDDALDRAGKSEGGEEIFVIGGGAIYEQVLDRADRLHITHVVAAPDGDTHFPAIDPAAWRRVSDEDVPAGEKDSFATRYSVYERIGTAPSPS